MEGLELNQLPQVQVDRIYKALRPEGVQINQVEEEEREPDHELIDSNTKITELEINGFKEQDRFLPMENVSRIMKKCLPPKTKVSKDAKETVQECTSEFISFITSEAADFCAGEKRKTITGEDILLAMVNLGFENYSEALKIYLTKYREHQSAIGKRTKKVKLGSVAEAPVAVEEEEEGEEEEEEEEDSEVEEDEEEELESDEI